MLLKPPSRGFDSTLSGRGELHAACRAPGDSGSAVPTSRRTENQRSSTSSVLRKSIRFPPILLDVLPVSRKGWRRADFGRILLGCDGMQSL